MAEDGGDFGYEDPDVGYVLDCDDDDDDNDDDDDEQLQEIDTIRLFQPGAVSTPSTVVNQ